MSPEDIVIVGGGISGLAALHYCRKMAPELSVRLFEKESCTGGTIGTEHVSGYSFDTGPNGFLDREPLTLALCHELGLGEKLERAGENVSRRYILRGGKLRAVPSSPLQFLASDVLSLSGKLRLITEPLVKAKPRAEDESVYDFGTRRIGKEAADYLIQPMVSGIFGGLAERLSLKSCFPVMTQMESKHGSLFKAMIAKSRESRKTGRNGNKSGRKGSPAGPAGWLTSFQGGLRTLVDTLHARHASAIFTGQCVNDIRKRAGCYLLRLGNGGEIQAKQVIIAVPSFVAAAVTEKLSESLSQTLKAIPYAPIAVVCSGFKAESVSGKLDGFGFLVPSKEKRRILGSIWTSSIFKERAPGGRVQFRTMVGGDGNHASAEMTDNELRKTVFEDLRDIVGLTGEPEITKIYRWRHGIPQYLVGHSELLGRIKRDLESLPGLYLSGNAYDGVGLNDCVKRSYAVVTAALKDRKHHPMTVS